MSQFTVATWAASSSFSAAYTPDNAGDQRWSAAANERWAASGSAPCWLRADLGTAKVAKWYRYDPGRAGTDATAWTFEGSNDASAWTVLDTQTAQPVSTRTRTYLISNTTAYRYYRMNISAGLSVAELEIGDGTPHSVLWDHEPISSMNNGDFTLGTVFRTTADVMLTHLLVYVTTSPAGEHYARLYDSSGAVIASATYTGVAGENSGWREVPITPIELPAGGVYMSSMKAPGRYPVRAGNHATAYTYGDLVIPASGTVTFLGSTATSRFAVGNAMPVTTATFESWTGVRVERASSENPRGGTSPVTAMRVGTTSVMRAFLGVAQVFGSPPMRLIETAQSIITDGANGIVTATLSSTPQAGDIVVVVHRSFRSVPRPVSSVAGLGATWTARGHSQTNSTSARLSVWTGTGANASGVVTLTQSNAGSAHIAVFLVRGLTATTVTIAPTPGGSDQLNTEPSLSAKAGDFVVVGYASMASTGTPALGGSPAPASGWSDLAAVTSGTNIALTSCRVPGEAAATTHSRGVVSSNYYGMAVRIGPGT